VSCLAKTRQNTGFYGVFGTLYETGDKTKNGQKTGQNSRF